MAAVKVMRRLLYPAGVLVAVPVFIPKVQAEEKKPCLQCCTKRLPKAYELPVYKKPEDPSQYELIEEPPNSLEQGISVVRKSVSKYLAVLEGAGKQASEIYETGVAHTKNTYEYLTDDANMIPRGLAVTTGGLVGLLLAARGGIIRKAIYASVGASAVAAACYPTQAGELIKTGFYATKDQTSALVLEYTGYDLSKMTTDAKEKLESFVDLKKLQDVPSSMMEWFKKASPIDQMGQKVSDVMYYGFKLLDMQSDSQVAPKAPTTNNASVSGDPGQSSSNDSDLYTTRSRS